MFAEKLDEMGMSLHILEKLRIRPLPGRLKGLRSSGKNIPINGIGGTLSGRYSNSCGGVSEMEISCFGFAVEYCRRFGQAAVERGFITPGQLKEALIEQVDDDLAKKPHRLLGDILLGKNYMTAAQIEAVLNDTLGFPAKTCIAAH